MRQCKGTNTQVKTNRPGINQVKRKKIKEKAKLPPPSTGKKTKNEREGGRERVCVSFTVWLCLFVFWEGERERE